MKNHIITRLNAHYNYINKTLTKSETFYFSKSLMLILDAVKHSNSFNDIEANVNKLYARAKTYTKSFTWLPFSDNKKAYLLAFELVNDILLKERSFYGSI